MIISSVHWHGTWQSRQSLASVFAGRGYRVIHLDPIPKRVPRLAEFSRVWGRLSGRAHMAGVAQQPVPEGVQLVAPLAAPDVGAGRWINRALFVPRLAHQLRQMHTTGPLVTLTALPTPAAVQLQDVLQPDVSIYHCAWDWAHDPYSNGLAKVERALVQTQDIILTDDGGANNARIASYDPPGRVLQLPHGYDPALFRAIAPNTFDRERGRCVYFGTVGPNIDVDLLRAVSHWYPLRIIGPIEVPMDGFAAGTEFVGPVAHPQLPEHLQDCEIILLPYDADAPHTAGVFPAKTFECLATGLPVVAHGLPSLRRYHPHITMVDDRAAYRDALREALAAFPVGREARLRLAHEHTWDAQADQLITLIDGVLAHGSA